MPNINTLMPKENPTISISMVAKKFVFNVNRAIILTIINNALLYLMVANQLILLENALSAQMDINSIHMEIVNS